MIIMMKMWIYSISISFPKLSYLYLRYYPRHGTFHHNFRESFQMENVTIIDLDGATLVIPSLTGWLNFLKDALS
uniref:Uncharacterized protein n=1 Tax=Cucumis melo TaxID=3656 RepID=A0A9I9EAD7_CUCME